MNNIDNHTIDTFKLSRFSYLFMMVIVLLTSCNQTSSTPIQSSKVILFMVEGLRWQDTFEPFWSHSTDMNKRFHTLNMERLLRKGMKFVQTYACPVGMPSPVSLMNGMSATRLGITDLRYTIKIDEEIKLNQSFGYGLESNLSNDVDVLATILPARLQKNVYFTIFCSHTSSTAAFSAIHAGSWRFIYFYRNQQFELYNLIGDISECHNLNEWELELLNQRAIRLGNYPRNIDACRPVNEKSGKTLDWPDELIKSSG